MSLTDETVLLPYGRHALTAIGLFSRYGQIQSRSRQAKQFSRNVIPTPCIECHCGECGECGECGYCDLMNIQTKEYSLNAFHCLSVCCLILSKSHIFWVKLDNILRALDSGTY